MKDQKQEKVLQIHRSIRSDYLKSEMLIIGLEVIGLFLTLQLITIFIPLLQTHLYDSPFRLNFTLSTIISLLYTIVRLYTKRKAFSIAKVQPKLEHLDELYATTVELKDVDTIPANAVREEFIEKARETSTYPLMNYKRLFLKTGFIAIILLLLMITPFVSSIKTIDTSWLVDLIPSNDLTNFFVEPDNVTLLSDEGIYGNQSYIVSGENNLDISLDLTTSGGDYANPLAWQNDVKSSNRFATTIEAKIDNPAIEKLPDEFELAKAYNLKIKQIK